MDFCISRLFFNNTNNNIIYETITHLRKFGYPEVSSINELTVKWATTRHSDSVNPLTMDEIELLRQYLIVKD